MHRLIKLALPLVLLICCITPARSWIFDGYSPSILGFQLKDDSSTAWAAAPFTVSQDAYVTKVGLYLSRAMGPTNAGFDVWLGRSLNYKPAGAMANWQVIPTTPTFRYYETTLDTPLYLYSGMSYFVMLAPSDPNFVGGVEYSLKGYYGFGSDDYGSSWTYLPYAISLRVDGYYAVPETSCLCAILPGLVGIWMIRRRN